MSLTVSENTTISEYYETIILVENVTNIKINKTKNYSAFTIKNQTNHEVEVNKKIILPDTTMLMMIL